MPCAPALLDPKSSDRAAVLPTGVVGGFNSSTGWCASERWCADPPVSWPVSGLKKGRRGSTKGRGICFLAKVRYHEYGASGIETAQSATAMVWNRKAMRMPTARVSIHCSFSG